VCPSRRERCETAQQKTKGASWKLNDTNRFQDAPYQLQRVVHSHRNQLVQKLMRQAARC
jgi:hypothetical protein